jgi:hypothetical protein
VRSPGEVAAAVRAVLTNPDPIQRTEELARLLQPLGPEALGEVKAAYDAFFVDPGDVATLLLAEWWARFDPQGAFEWTRSEWTGRHPAVVMSVVYAWATRAPEEARRALEEIREPVHSKACREALISGWHESGKPGLLDFIASIPSEIDRQHTIALLMRRKVRRDGVEQTFRWAEALPDGPDRFKLNVFRRVASAVTEVDPHRAAAWAVRHSEGEYGKGLFRRVGVRWANWDGRAALMWLATLPPGWERDVGVQEAYRNWLGRQHEDAMDWMRGAELEPWLDPALALFAMSLSRRSPEEGLEWAARVHDEERRREALVRSARGWRATDPEAAQAWLDRSELPEQARERILAPLRPPRDRRGAAPQEDPGDPKD